MFSTAIAPKENLEKESTEQELSKARENSCYFCMLDIFNQNNVSLCQMLNGIKHNLQKQMQRAQATHQHRPHTCFAAMPNLQKPHLFEM